MPDKVTVRYVGPNAEADPRTLKVSEPEAAALIKTGLYAKRAQAKTTTKKKEEVTPDA